MNADQLLELFEDPARAARLAASARAAGHGQRIRIVVHPAPATAPPSRATDNAENHDWPAPQAGAHLVLQVDPTPQGRAAFAGYLVRTTWPESISLAPYSRAAAGLHRLWCIAAARIVLPASASVQARHDLLGIRLAQIALGFGADTLSGPLDPDRKLPLAGVTRPAEATRAGLETLIRQAGLVPEPRPRTDHEHKQAAALL